MHNFFDWKKLANKREAENHVAKFFATKPQKFYTDVITKLPEKWHICSHITVIYNKEKFHSNIKKKSENTF